jgi:putative transcriptional regulator
METNVIRWKLNELMARMRVRNKDLAEALSITENSVYRLRKTDEMPRLSPERLNGICTALNCQPGDLMEWVLDPNGSNARQLPIGNQEIKVAEVLGAPVQNDTQLFKVA